MKNTKVVINKCYGGFGVSRQLIEYLRKKNVKWALETPIYDGEKYDDGSFYIENEFNIWHTVEEYRKDNNSFFPDVNRTDKDLIEAIETLGSKVASGDASELKIVEIPENIHFMINDYDGVETIHETHRTWG